MQEQVIELIDAAEIEEPPFPTEYEMNGKTVQLLLNPNIVTADFLDGLDTITRDERRAALIAQTRKAANQNRSTRRAAKSKRGKAKLEEAAAEEGVELNAESAVAPPSPDEETSLASKARSLRFMADTCARVVLRWSLASRASKGAPLVMIEPTLDYFLTWHLDRLRPFFEFVCFEAASPSKKTNETSDDSSSTDVE
jgi:hypothetical protein